MLTSETRRFLPFPSKTKRFQVLTRSSLTLSYLSCREAGGAFGKMEQAHEEQYFRQLVNFEDLFPFVYICHSFICPFIQSSISCFLIQNLNLNDVSLPQTYLSYDPFRCVQKVGDCLPAQLHSWRHCLITLMIVYIKQSDKMSVFKGAGTHKRTAMAKQCHQIPIYCQS